MRHNEPHCLRSSPEGERRPDPGSAISLPLPGAGPVLARLSTKDRRQSMSLKDLFRRKSIERLTESADNAEGPKLNKILTAKDVFNHGVAAIIGAGIFVLTGVAAAKFAGPGIILSFVFAGIACALVAFAYAELASMIPVSGSAYTYSYATLGEVVAWIIGWDLLLEYAVGSSAVAVGWSAYLQHVLKGLGITLPDYLAQAPANLPWSAVGIAVSLLVVGAVASRRA